MPYLIGTDEAGYGPNLGPLIISATVWKISDNQLADLYPPLRRAVCQPPFVANGRPADKVAIADSKLLYKPKQSLAPLETSLLSCLAQVAPVPRTWRNGWTTLAGESGAQRDDAPWHRDYDRPLPVASEAQQIDHLSKRLTAEMHSAGIELVAVRSRALFPQQFNELCSHFGTKGGVLTDQTIGLVAELVAELDEPCRIVCDKHGGRNRYGGVLQHYFADRPLMIEREGRASSAYRLGEAARRLAFEFRTGGEAFLPAALASMASKYLRELAMMAFNNYWLAAVPGLRPTAGYPVDARRFREQIEQVQRRRGIADACLWRER